MLKHIGGVLIVGLPTFAGLISGFVHRPVNRPLPTLSHCSAELVFLGADLLLYVVVYVFVELVMPVNNCIDGLLLLFAVLLLDLGLMRLVLLDQLVLYG